MLIFRGVPGSLIKAFSPASPPQLPHENTPFLRCELEECLVVFPPKKTTNRKHASIGSSTTCILFIIINHIKMKDKYIPFIRFIKNQPSVIQPPIPTNPGLNVTSTPDNGIPCVWNVLFCLYTTYVYLDWILLHIFF